MDLAILPVNWLEDLREVALGIEGVLHFEAVIVDDLDNGLGALVPEWFVIVNVLWVVPECEHLSCQFQSLQYAVLELLLLEKFFLVVRRADDLLEERDVLPDEEVLDFGERSAGAVDII